MDYETQWFNFCNAMADSVMDMSDEEVMEEIKMHGDNTDEIRNRILAAIPKNCVYLCGPHLETCQSLRGHREDCVCLKCDEEARGINIYPL